MKVLEEEKKDFEKYLEPYLKIYSNSIVYEQVNYRCPCLVSKVLMSSIFQSTIMMTNTTYLFRLCDYDKCYYSIKHKEKKYFIMIV